MTLEAELEAWGQTRVGLHKMVRTSGSLHSAVLNVKWHYCFRNSVLVLTFCSQSYLFLNFVPRLSLDTMLLLVVKFFAISKGQNCFTMEGSGVVERFVGCGLGGGYIWLCVPMSWLAKKQNCVAFSSMEAKYVALTQEGICLRNSLR